VRRTAVFTMAGPTLVSGLLCAAPAHADSGWAPIANSPSREESDYSWNPSATQAAAEAQALQKCLVQENATDCRVVASGPSCAAIAWDGVEPLNHAHGGVGATLEEAIAAAVAAAGPYANDPAVRCSWNPNPTVVIVSARALAADRGCRIRLGGDTFGLS
jgi:hypothetical protein